MRRIVGPGLPITVEQARQNGRIDHDAEDALVEDCIRAALAYAEKWAGVAFQSQTWEMTLDAFPAHEIEIPFAPVTSVTSVGFTDPAGAPQATTDYEVDLDQYGRAWIIPTGAWPATMTTVNAVRVQFVAGDTPPDDVRRALLLLTQHYYENRAATGEDVKPIPLGVFDLLNLHRRMFV